MEKKTEVLHFRIDEEMKKELERRANIERRTLTNYIYCILDDYIRKEEK